MDKPKCDVCGSHHWMREPHVFREDKIEAFEVSRKKNKRALKELSETPVERVKSWRKDNHDRYNEYQREYMREYRAGKRRR